MYRNPFSFHVCGMCCSICHRHTLPTSVAVSVNFQVPSEMTRIFSTSDVKTSLPLWEWIKMVFRPSVLFCRGGGWWGSLKHKHVKRRKVGWSGGFSVCVLVKCVQHSLVTISCALLSFPCLSPAAALSNPLLLLNIHTWHFLVWRENYNCQESKGRGALWRKQ